MENFLTKLALGVLPGRRLLVAGLVLAWMGTLALVAGTLWWAVRERSSASDRVEHTHAVLLAAERLMTAAGEAETSQRGFLLTLDPVYLEPYQRGAGRVSKRLNDLRLLVTGNPVLEQRLAALSGFIEEKRAELDATIARAREGDEAGALALVRLGDGRRSMDRIRASLATLVAEEEKTLSERQALETSATHRMQRVLVMLGLTVLALMALLTERFVRGVTRTARMEQETQFQTMVDGLPALCWVAEADGWIFWYSQRWYEYTGTTPEQMQGWGWQSVHDPETLPRVLDRWKQSIASGEAFEMIFPLRGADGEYRPFLTRATPLHAPNGRVIRWFGANTDVTETQRARETLERMVEERTASLLREVEERRVAEEALRQSEKMQLLGQFTGGIAHDFNNVLQVVISGAGLLRSPRLTPARRETLLQEMERSARNAAEMVSRLLSFARRQVLSPSAFDVNERLRGMTDMLSRALGSRVNVVTDLASDLWPVLADPNQFEVALLNLAVNARDAMPEGGTLTMRTRNGVREDGEDEVLITVQDTGTGMSPTVRARVFEPFFTTKGVGKGTGLGLPQVQGFARQSGGDVRIDSALGKGAQVTMCLPRAATAAKRNETADETEGEARPAGRRNILVVEDNPEVAALATTMLEGLDHAVTHARNAPDALARIEAGEAVDAVFSDVVMPGHINGAELASILCLRYPGIAVVMATGYTDQRDRLSGLPVEVLDKPYTLDALTAALDRALRRAARKTAAVS